MAELALLRPHLLDAKGPLFAVLDGAQFDDLPAALFDGDFVHKPLYLDGRDGDRDRVLTAPQLIWLDRDANTPASADVDIAATASPEILDRLLELVGDRHAAVFWECPDGGDILYRHLRTLNMVMFPRDANLDPGKGYEADPSREASDVVETNAVTQPSHELVLFRHADANVMAQIVPALEREQLARLFGPATQLLLLPDVEWSGGRPMRARRPDNLPKAPAGPLRLEVGTVAAIEDARKAAFNRRVAAYLRKIAPDRTRDLNDAVFEQQVDRSISDATAFGVKSQAAHCQWAYMNLVTNGELSGNAAVRELMTSQAPGYSPDTRVRMLMKHALFHLKNQGTA